MNKLLESTIETLNVSENAIPSDWVEAHRILSGYAAEPGAISLKRAPYQREWLDITTQGYHNVCIMKSAQVGGSETVTSFIGYLADTAKTPTPIMLIHPTLGAAEKFSKDRIMPMFRDSPRLHDRLDMGSRNSDNAVLHKRFKDRDVTLDIVGANSPAALASQTIRVLIADEIDKYPVLETGDALTLAEKRTQTFKNSIRYYISTPTTKGRSRIEKLWIESDQRQYYVPCPDCDHEQTLVIERLVYVEGVPHYTCESCGSHIKEHQKQNMMEAGRWVPKFPKRSEKLVGYHINELYSPWSTWEKILDDFHSRKGNDALLRPFYNESLGLPYDEVQSDAPDYAAHQQARIPRVTDTLPDQAIYITAACDVQRDRLEVVVVAWYKRICTVIDRIFIPGNPKNLNDPCWDELTRVTKRTWKHKTRGEERICCTAIDSGDGNTTNAVYNWARKRKIHRVMIIKGVGIDKNLGTEIGSPSDIEIRQDGGRYRIAHKLWPVNTHMLKQLIYTTLATQKEDSDTRFVFSEVCDDEFFKQLTAETLVRHTDEKGDTKLMWKLTYKDNHALDMMVYNYALYYHLSMHAFKHEHWDWLLEAGDIKKRERKNEQIRQQRAHNEQRATLRDMDPLGYYSGNYNDGPWISLTGRNKKYW